MKLLFRKIFVFTLFSLILVSSVFAQSTAKKTTCPKGSSNFGLCETAVESGIKDLSISQKKDPIVVASDIIALALSFLGIIFFLIILYAGLKWMIAMGSTDKIDSAKDMLEGAAVGLLIVIASYALARFIFTNLGLTT